MNFGCGGLELRFQIGNPKPSDCIFPWPNGYPFPPDIRIGANGNGECDGLSRDGMYRGTCCEGAAAADDDGKGYSKGGAWEDA
jgi:hypothetical protein